MIVPLVLITLSLVCWLLSLGVAMANNDPATPSCSATIFSALALVLAFAAGTHS